MCVVEAFVDITWCHPPTVTWAHSALVFVGTRVFAVKRTGRNGLTGFIVAGIHASRLLHTPSSALNSFRSINVTRIRITVVQVSANIAVTLETRNAAAVIASRCVDTFPRLVASVRRTRLRLALIQIMVAVLVLPADLALANVRVASVFAFPMLAWALSTIVNFFARTLLARPDEAILAFAGPGARRVCANAKPLIAVIGHESAFIDVCVALEISVPFVARALVSHGSEVSAHAVSTPGIRSDAIVNIRARDPAGRQIKAHRLNVIWAALRQSVFVTELARAEERAICLLAISVSVAVVDVKLAISHVHVTVGVRPALVALALKRVYTSINTSTRRVPAWARCG